MQYTNDNWNLYTLHNQIDGPDIRPVLKVLNYHYDVIADHTSNSL